MSKKGKAYLVGAGPGDPDLITLKGKELIETTDVIIYDSLVNPRLLDLSRESAELIYVGKKIGHKEYSQKEINRLILNRTNRGKNVVRLKGGDPFVFGRGGEEAKFLIENGTEVEIVPGISSVMAVPAYSGVPVTHRDYNSSFAVFTGHESKFNNTEDTDLDYLKKMKTLVFLMGLSNIKNIMKKLLLAGKKPETPVLIVTNGTLPNQKSLHGTISNIDRQLKKNPQIITPATIVVGEIVNLGKELNWFEKKPLFGKKIIATRNLTQIPEFERELNQKGAEVFRFPTIEIKPLVNTGKIREAIKKIDDYNLLIFTSVNGVKYFFEALKLQNRDSRALGNKTIITIGEKTAKELGKYNISSDYTPDEYVAEAIVNLCDQIGIENKNILIPRAKVAREVLPEQLGKKRNKVDVVPVYETRIPKYKKKFVDDLKKKIKNGEIGIVTFTSSSTVINYFELLGKGKKLHSKTVFACIGPITADTLRHYEVEPHIIADTYTVNGLIEKMVDFFKP